LIDRYHPFEKLFSASFLKINVSLTLDEVPDKVQLQPHMYIKDKLYKQDFLL